MSNHLFLQTMKRLLFILFSFFFLFISTIKAQNEQNTFSPLAYDYAYRIVVQGDTTWMIHMKNIYVFPTQQFKNKKEEKFYWKTVRDVKKTLPYAKLIYDILIETYEYIETLPDDEARNEHLKRMEKEVFQQYKPILKKFTLSQGKLLIKLIDRECNQSSFELIKAFLGGFRANFWQFFGSMFGASLKSEYDPEGKDRIIEKICLQVEQGTL